MLEATDFDEYEKLCEEVEGDTTDPIWVAGQLRWAKPRAQAIVLTTQAIAILADAPDAWHSLEELAVAIAAENEEEVLNPGQYKNLTRGLEVACCAGRLQSQGEGDEREFCYAVEPEADEEEAEAIAPPPWDSALAGSRERIYLGRQTVAIADADYSVAIAARGGKLNQQAVRRYAEQYAGGLFPREDGLAVRDPEGSIYCFDGWHRATAKGQAGWETVELEIYAGDRDTALLMAAQCNQGVAVSGKQRQEMARQLLLQFQNMSCNDVGKIVGIDPKTAGRIEQDLVNEELLPPLRPVVAIRGKGEKRHYYPSTSNKVKQELPTDEPVDSAIEDGAPPNEPEASAIGCLLGENRTEVMLAKANTYDRLVELIRNWRQASRVSGPKILQSVEELLHEIERSVVAEPES